MKVLRLQHVKDRISKIKKFKRFKTVEEKLSKVITKKKTDAKDFHNTFIQLNEQNLQIQSKINMHMTVLEELNMKRKEFNKLKIFYY